jgi:hypothetical protein
MRVGCGHFCDLVKEAHVYLLNQVRLLADVGRRPSADIPSDQTAPANTRAAVGIEALGLRVTRVELQHVPVGP